MPKPQGLTPAQQRERRSKIMAIGASVVFVIVLAVQAPKLLHGSKKTTAMTAAPVAPAASSSVITAGPAAARVAAAQEAASSALPTLDGQTAAPIAAPATLPALTASGQLATFHLFPLKDPFRAQVSDTTGGSSSNSKSTASSSKAAPGSSSASSSTSGSKSSSTGQGGSPPALVGTPSVPQLPTATTPQQQSQPQPAATKSGAKAKKKQHHKAKPLPPNAALITVDGEKQVVPVGVDFPQKTPLFKLVKLTLKPRLIRIGVLNGSFTAGMPTMPLKQGQKLTLQNESDGSQYVVKVLKLVHISAAQLAAIEQPASGTAPAATTGATATTPAATTTTPAATTTTGGTPPSAPSAPATTTTSLVAGVKR